MDAVFKWLYGNRGSGEAAFGRDRTDRGLDRAQRAPPPRAEPGSGIRYRARTGPEPSGRFRAPSGSDSVRTAADGGRLSGWLVSPTFRNTRFAQDHE